MKPYIVDKYFYILQTDWLKNIRTRSLSHTFTQEGSLVLPALFIHFIFTIDLENRESECRENRLLLQNCIGQSSHKLG